MSPGSIPLNDVRRAGVEPAPERDVRTDEMIVSMGPQHPSTHGLLRVVLRIDGELVVEAMPQIGYLHRCVEKIGERRIGIAAQILVEHRKHRPRDAIASTRNHHEPDISYQVAKRNGQPAFAAASPRLPASTRTAMRFVRGRSAFSISGCLNSPAASTRSATSSRILYVNGFVPTARFSDFWNFAVAIICMVRVILRMFRTALRRFMMARALAMVLPLSRRTSRPTGRVRDESLNRSKRQVRAADVCKSGTSSARSPARLVRITRDERGMNQTGTAPRRHVVIPAHAGIQMLE